MPPTTERLQHIAAMFARHADELRDLVRRRASGAQPATIDDACSFAWTQLISAEHIDVRPPRWSALAWLTTTAICARPGRSRPPSGAPRPTTTASCTRSRSRAVSATRPPTSAPRCTLALDLVAQIPERPRRFPLRLALGYSYDEISIAEWSRSALPCSAWATVRRRSVSGRTLAR